MERAQNWKGFDAKDFYANTTGSFEPCKFLNRGLYMKHINRFLEFFPREQVHVFIFEGMKFRKRLVGVEREYDPVFRAIGMSKAQRRQLKLTGMEKERVGFYNGYQVPFRDPSLKEWRCSTYNSVHRHTNELLFQWLGRRIASWDMPDCDNEMVTACKC